MKDSTPSTIMLTSPSGFAGGIRVALGDDVPLGRNAASSRGSPVDAAPPGSRFDGRDMHAASDHAVSTRSSESTTKGGGTTSTGAGPATLPGSISNTTPGTTPGTAPDGTPGTSDTAPGTPPGTRPDIAPEISSFNHAQGSDAAAPVANSLERASDPASNDPSNAQDASFGSKSNASSPSSAGAFNATPVVEDVSHASIPTSTNASPSYGATSLYDAAAPAIHQGVPVDNAASAAGSVIPLSPPVHTNLGPIAQGASFVTSESSAVAGRLDPNNGSQGGGEWSLASDPAHGSAVVHADGTFSYTPAATYDGTDSFIYKITYGDGSSSSATVSLNITPVDFVPVAHGGSFSTPEDGTASGNLAGNDSPSLDGGNTWSLVTGPAHGNVTITSDGTFSYTPTTTYNGADSFTYNITDAEGSTSTATVSLNVTPVDFVPVAKNDSFTTAEDAPVSGNLATNDMPSADGGSVWSLVTGPAHGSVTVNADGTFSYTPTTTYNGADSFTYKITDADGSTSTATVSLNVTPVDFVPVAKNDSFTTTEDAPVSGNLATNDTPSADGGNVWSLVTGPAHGSVTVNSDGTFSYTPTTTYNGADSFTYGVTDADGSTSTATVTLSVTPVDFVPVAKND
ncbi:MAG TPA: Ig-like domain-containing protein [Polyangia bacterium]|nr:Ig-like domain-containing protein [Polyangia bacterium]